MKHTLSSSLTFTLKFLLPICLFSGWLISIVNVYVDYWGRNSYLRFVAPLIFAAIIFNSWEFVRFKKVSVDDEYLYVSNFLRKIRIPFKDIDEVVEQNWAGLTYPIEISLRDPSEIGSTIKFMPKVKFGHSVRDSNVVVAELRRLAGES